MRFFAQLHPAFSLVLAQARKHPHHPGNFLRHRIINIPQNFWGHDKIMRHPCHTDDINVVIKNFFDRTGISLI